MRLGRLDLNLLVALNALLTEQSVSAAAEHCFLTPSAMSHALGRLRDHFGDELLLVASGRRMVLTPRGESLREPVRTALRQIDLVLHDRTLFDPLRSERRFAIHASDYSLSVGLAQGLARARTLAPGIMFDISMPDDPSTALERGSVDLIVVPRLHMVPSHPSAELYRDEFVAVMCASSPLAGQDLTEELYFAAQHAIVHFGNNRAGEFSETLTLAAPRPRQVAVTVASFTMAPLLLAGTSLIATLPRLLAERAARTQPLVIKPLPFQGAEIVELVQWNRADNGDPALAWLVARMVEGFVASD